MRAGAADYWSRRSFNPIHWSEAFGMRSASARLRLRLSSRAGSPLRRGDRLMLTRRDSLKAIMDRCSQAMVKYLNAAIARIETFDLNTGNFETLAMSGPSLDHLLPCAICHRFRWSPGRLGNGNRS